MFTYVFQRTEIKYLLSPEQYKILCPIVEGRMRPDAYGETTIQSLYYDTPDFRIIRNSNDKPVFKEKIRLRSYGLCSGGNVFLEMKRKYNGVVYKRRISFPEAETEKYFSGSFEPEDQIGREIKYFVNFYQGLEPKALILSDRRAYFDEDEFRLTFDRNLRYRLDDLNLHTSVDGIPFVDDGYVVMELKTGSAIPLWMSELLSEYKIQKASLSKYGTVYRLKYLNAQLSQILSEGD